MVRLYYTKADSALYYVKNAQSYLSPRRYEQFCRLQNENDKLLCLAAGMLLSKVLGRDSVGKIKIAQHGKPYLESGEYFNIAHSGNFVVLAVDNEPVGVDIEQRRERGYEGIARLSFHEKEQAQLKRSANRQKTFYELWTLKESYMKAVGRGFNLPPSSFYFELGSPITLHSEEKGQYRFTIHYGIEGYTIALCSKSGHYDGKLIYKAL